MSAYLVPSADSTPQKSPLIERVKNISGPLVKEISVPEAVWNRTVCAKPVAAEKLCVNVAPDCCAPVVTEVTVPVPKGMGDQV